MASITVATGAAPYGSERFYSALRFALVARHEEHQVNLFCYEDAIVGLKQGQRPPEFPLPTNERMPNCEELVRAALSESVVVKACGVCAAERGLCQEEFVPGAQMGTMKDLVDWVVTSDRAVFL